MTIASVKGVVAGDLNTNYRMELRFMAFDSSYPTGGEAMLAADYGSIINPIAVLFFPAQGVIFEYVASTRKVKAYGVDPAAAGGAVVAFPEIASTGSLAACTAVPYIVIGC